MKRRCCCRIKPIQMWIRSHAANFTSRHAFETSFFFFTTRQYLCWSTINRRFWLQLATLVSYQTFRFFICWKRAPETRCCQNQLHRSAAPLGSKRVYFLIKAFVPLVMTTFDMHPPCRPTCQGTGIIDRRCVFVMHDECVTARVSKDWEGLICERCQEMIFFTSNPTKSNTSSNNISNVQCYKHWLGEKQSHLGGIHILFLCHLRFLTSWNSFFFFWNRKCFHLPIIWYFIPHNHRT